jgi:hypothetical protein
MTTSGSWRILPSFLSPTTTTLTSRSIPGSFLLNHLMQSAPSHAPTAITSIAFCTPTVWPAKTTGGTRPTSSPPWKTSLHPGVRIFRVYATGTPYRFRGPLSRAPLTSTGQAGRSPTAERTGPSSTSFSTAFGRAFSNTRVPPSQNLCRRVPR